MFTWNEALYAQERRKDELANAEKERLIRHVIRYSPALKRYYQRWLVRLGTQLVNWGRELEVRYAVERTPSPYAG